MNNDMIPQQVILLVSLLLSLISIFFSNLPLVGGILAIIATISTIILGVNTVRHIGNYSLGTGVPSIVYLLSSIGLMGFFAGLIISFKFNNANLFPFVSIIVTLIISYILAELCKHILNIHIEILNKSFMQIALASMLSTLSMSTIIATTYDPIIIMDVVVKNGLILLLFIIVIMAIQNAYNSCMGPNEDQYRVLYLAGSNGCLMISLVSFISIFYNPYWCILLVLCLIGWVVSIKKYIYYSKRQAASVRWSGLWPKNEME